MDNPLHAYPGYLLRRAAAARMAELSAGLEPLSLTVSEATVVLMVARNPGLSQSEVGRMLAIQRTNMNPMVRRLSDRGIITMRAHGQRQGLFLADDSAALAATIARIVEEHEARVMALVPADLRASVIPVLTALWNPAVAGDSTPLGE